MLSILQGFDMGHANTNNLFGRYPSAVARQYGVGVHSFTHERQLRLITNLLAIADAGSPVSTVLDCPCGSGRLVDLLKQYELTCADACSDRLRRVKQSFADVDMKLERCDVFDMGFADDSFDLVVNMLLLQHIEKSRLPELFTELVRVTKKWMIISYSYRYAVFSIARRFKKRVPNNVLSQAEFDALAREAGFDVVAKRSVVPVVGATNIALLQKIP